MQCVKNKLFMKNTSILQIALYQNIQIKKTIRLTIKTIYLFLNVGNPWLPVPILWQVWLCFEIVNGQKVWSDFELKMFRTLTFQLRYDR